MCSDSWVLVQQQSNIHCTKKYWRTNTTTGKYKHARQFFSIVTPFYPSCLVPPAVTLRLHLSVSPSSAVYPSPSLFGSLLSPLTLRLRSPNSLFPLLVFVSASQSHASRSYLQFVVLSPYSLQPASSSLLSLLLAFLLVQSAHVHSHWASARAETRMGWSEYSHVVPYL